jgi:DNA polymerase-1
MSRLLLVDGTNLVMRYAFAMAPQFVKEPENPAAPETVARVASACVTAVRDCADVAMCSHVVVALDSHDSWRKELYPDYKLGRSVSTRVWSAHFAAECERRSVHAVRSDGYEADDVIATLARRASESARSCAVLSSDSDLLVLATESCDVYQFGRGDEPRFIKRSSEWIASKYGIATAGHLHALKAIAGESGDNLPGLDGYGPVKARRLLERWGTVEALLQSCALTQAQHERLTLMLNLVRLRDDAPIPAISSAECRIAA